MHDPSANRRGILGMVGGCGCYSANDAATKVAAVYLPVTEIVAPPDALSAFGIGLIVSAGLYMLHRKTVRRRKSTISAA